MPPLLLQLLPWLAGAIAIVAYVPYLRDTWSGKTRPNRATWWIYTVVGLVATSGSFAVGARESLTVPLVYATASLAVALVAIKRGEGGFTLLDRSCLATAAVSIVLWIATGDPVLAVLLNCVADLAGSLPTMVKAWREPARENRWGWILFLTANSLNLLLISDWNAWVSLYPVTLWFCSLVITAGCVLARRASAAPHPA